MARRTNLALLLLLLALFATGALGLVFGTAPSRWALVAHGIAAACVLLLARRKLAIIRSGLRRQRRGREVSLLFAVLVVLALVTGVLHMTGAVRDFGGYTVMAYHITFALLILPLFAWHVTVRRVRARRTDLSRRALLRNGVLLGGGAVVFAATEIALRISGLPGENRRFTGSYQVASRDPGAIPITQWLTDSVPQVDVGAYRLSVTTPRGQRFHTHDALLAFDDHVVATLDCTGGFWSEQEWHGVLLDRLITDTGGARSVEVRSITGYSRRFPIDDLPCLLLATRVADRVLDGGHGFPARIVAPDRRGFWWVKWVTSISVDPTPWWWQPPFPVQ
jgi:hypothetical protein